MGDVKTSGFVSSMRVHDYLYDSAFIVSGARDYARAAFRAAMDSSQKKVYPSYKNMFSETRRRPNKQIVYHPNCRLPGHLDLSYQAYVQRVDEIKSWPTPEFNGKDRFKFVVIPRSALQLPTTTPEFKLPVVDEKPIPIKLRNRGTQSVYRESSAQTKPWQPDGRPARECTETPEVLYLDKLEWGPGCPYRIGDLPADFHTTEIINKMRHARRWTEVVEKAVFPRWMKKRDQIIEDVETKDWIFREAEIDELQDIRLELLHRIQTMERQKQTNKTSQKLAKMWAIKKEEMEIKITKIRKIRDREHRKLVALHEGGGSSGLVSRLRAARGHGSMILAATDPTSDLHAPLLRNGYQARRRHAEISYDPSLLSAEDHDAIAAPPAWLDTCTNLTKTCSGNHLPVDKMKLCERETKWSDEFLETLHNDLKKARLGAALTSAGPLHVLKPRRALVTPRPETPVVDSVDDIEETEHQCALLLQRLIKGRAVQYLMYEGRTRASELTEELKTTHGLQKEDKLRIAREEAKAREYNARRTDTEIREDAITALVDELCGGAVSAALDFLEKELRRLKGERRQHAFILIALREKTMREAAEAGRRQKEECRRREHDEMFKRILGTTQETVDAYLKQIIHEGIELAAEEEAVKAAMAKADRIDQANIENSALSTAEQSEVVADLVHQFLLPHAHKTAARHKIEVQQKSRLETARRAIFGLIDEAEIKPDICHRCGRIMDDLCRCKKCPIRMEPVETKYRQDPRWVMTRMRDMPTVKTTEEIFPPLHETRYLTEAIVADAVTQSRHIKDITKVMYHDMESTLMEKFYGVLDVKDMLDVVVDVATDKIPPPPKEIDYHYLMKRVVPDAQERDEPFKEQPCPKKLPSQIRQEALDEIFREDPSCRCVVHSPSQADLAVQTEGAVSFRLEGTSEDAESRTKKTLLPSDVRVLEELKKCKCDLESSDDESTSLTDPRDSDY